MWAAILALGPALIGLIGKLFGGGKDKNADMARELGREEQQNADMKQDMATVRKANEAARQSAQEPHDKPDPNDLDAR